jgi:tetratricopeptide (TPR) repeat protein
MGTSNRLSNNKASRLVQCGSVKMVEDRSSSANPPKRRRLNLDPLFGKQLVSSQPVSHSMQVVDTNNKAVSSFNKGDFDAASKLFQEAVTMSRQAFLASKQHHEKSQSGKEPPTSSYIYQRFDFDEGMNAYSAVEPVHLNDHPVSIEATVLFNAGQARRKLEDQEGAYSYYELALQTFIPQGCVHPVIVPILHNLGQIAYRQGNLKEAIAAYDVALTHCRAIRGDDDLSVGITLNCLGVLHYHLSADESAKAMDYFGGALRILSDKLGPDSAAVATSLNNLGRVMVQREDFVSALAHYEKALEIRCRQLGEDNIDSAATAFNAGQSLHQLGHYDRALKLYHVFLRVALVKFSKSHRDIAVVLSGIAQIHQERKEFKQALEFYEESLKVGTAALGEYHSEVAMILNRIGNFYFEQEDFDAALKVYKKGLRVERQLLESTHPNIIVTLSNIGEIYRQQADFRRAVRLYTEAMELQKRRHGSQSAEVASTLNVIGLIHDQKGESGLALKRLQEALVMRRVVQGDDHLDVSATLTYIGTIFYRRNMVTNAMQLFTESLRIRHTKLGRDHRDVSFTLYNIGLCHQLQGNYKEALECFSETLRVEKLVLKCTHRDVSLTLFKLGEVYKAQGDIDSALENFENALDMERQLNGKDDPSTIARTLTEIGNIHLEKGNTTEMMDAFNEAARVFRRAGLSVSSVTVSGLRLYAAGFASAAPAA